MILRWVQQALWFSGIGLLGYSGFVLVDTWRFQTDENRALDQARENAEGVNESPSAESFRDPAASDGRLSSEADAARQRTRIVRQSGASRKLIGRIEIPRVGLSAIVMQGSDSAILRRAVGHIPATALPGETGNAVLTAHRDTFFRPLKNIREGDGIRFTTATSRYLYRVVSISVVDPSNTAVIKSTREETLTLITCFPFSYVGPAPRRFVVRAERSLSDQGRFEHGPTAARLEPQLQ